MKKKKKQAIINAIYIIIDSQFPEIDADGTDLNNGEKEKKPYDI